MADPIRIFIDSHGVARVSPGMGFAERGNKFEWRNLTDDAVEIMFPDDTLELDGRPLPRPLPIAKKKSKSPKVRTGADLGAKPYSVYCHATGTFAIGNSHPEIIIEP